MKKKINDIGKKLLIGLLVLPLLWVAIAFSEKKHQTKLVNKVVVKIDNEYENYFLNDSDILGLMTGNGVEYIQGSTYEDVNLKELERRVNQHPFVKKSEVYKDHKGHVVVSIKQTRPIARILSGNGVQAGYISEEGKWLPLSSRFTARVPVLTGKGLRKYSNNNGLLEGKGQELLALLHFMDEDELWRAQIAEIEIGEDGHLIFHQQVGKQFIEFGDTQDIEKKFKKLKIFYRDILPGKGWNTYAKVNLKFENQIICE